jgi:hypothetical protein
MRTTANNKKAAPFYLCNVIEYKLILAPTGLFKNT